MSFLVGLDPALFANVLFTSNQDPAVVKKQAIGLTPLAAVILALAHEITDPADMKAEDLKLIMMTLTMINSYLDLSVLAMTPLGVKQ